FKFQMHSWRAFFDLLGLPAWIAMPAFAAVAIAITALATICWRAGGSLRLRFSALLIATLLVNPHLYVFALLLVGPALLLLWDWVVDEPDRSLGRLLPLVDGTPIGRWPFRFVFESFLAICLFSPALGATAITTRVQLSVLFHSALLVAITYFQTTDQ